MTKSISGKMTISNLECTEYDLHVFVFKSHEKQSDGTRWKRDFGLDDFETGLLEYSAFRGGRVFHGGGEMHDQIPVIH